MEIRREFRHPRCESKKVLSRLEKRRCKRRLPFRRVERKTAEQWRGRFCLRSDGSTARRKRRGNRSERKNRRNRPDVRLEHRQGRIGLSHRSATERNSIGRLPSAKSVAIHRYA